MSDDLAVGIAKKISVPVGALSADAIGEYLRGRAFPESGDGEFGCYTTFVVREDAVEMPPKQRLALLSMIWDQDPDDDLILEAAESRGYVFSEDDWRIEMIWFWDGDGMLAFRVWVPQGLICAVANTDCKKPYGWTWLSVPKTPLRA